MVRRIDRLSLRITVEMYEGYQGLTVDYTPICDSTEIPLLKGAVAVPKPEWEADLGQRLERLLDIFRQRFARGDFEIDSETVSASAHLGEVSFWIDSGLVSATLLRADTISSDHGLISQLSAAQQRLLSSVVASCERLAWEDLRRKASLLQPVAPREILISYRATKEDFAEALARRLGQEGIVPFFDRWDVKAGDSIPEKIEEAFARSMACIVVLSEDFKEGQWATAELETAITKHIQEGYKVIPVLYETCVVPELLKPLRHVDFSDHDSQAFETKFGELIDAVYGLELNPFRA